MLLIIAGTKSLNWEVEDLENDAEMASERV